MPYLIHDPENGRFFHVDLASVVARDAPAYALLFRPMPAEEAQAALADALRITSRLPAAGGPPTPWPFVRRRR
jgi:hypothetical protein